MCACISETAAATATLKGIEILTQTIKLSKFSAKNSWDRRTLLFVEGKKFTPSFGHVVEAVYFFLSVAPCVWKGVCLRGKHREVRPQLCTLKNVGFKVVLVLGMLLPRSIEVKAHYSEQCACYVWLSMCVIYYILVN